MSKQTRGLSPLYSFLPAEIEGFDELAELALDLRGRTDARGAALELAQANDALSAILRHSSLRAA